LGGDREVVSGDLAVARCDSEVLCRASEILGGESDSGRVEGAKRGHRRAPPMHADAGRHGVMKLFERRRID
jgi:hypothetical protein